MKWTELSQVLTILEVKGNIPPNISISNISHHSGKIKENGLFVAIPGLITDGHKYIPKAIENGAVLAIVEKFTDDKIPQVKVENTRIALAQLANKFYDYPSNKMKIIGITATNGKTTTSFMLTEVLKQAGYNVGIIGTVEIKYGNTIIPSELTTPESIDLQKYLYQMEKESVDIVIMEVSSSAQELYRNYGINYDIVSFHNISEEHIEQHGTYEKYFESKSKLILEASKDTAVILNNDFPELTNLAQNTHGEVFTISSINENLTDLFLSELDLSSGKGKFLCNIQEKAYPKWSLNNEKFSVELGVAGYSSVINSLVAIVISKLLKVDNQVIIDALKAFLGVERRFEMIYDNNFKVLDDHFANLKNIEITMSTLEQMSFNKLHIIYAIRGNRGVNLNYSNAKELIHWIHKLEPENVIISKSTDTTTDKDYVSAEEEKYCKKAFVENKIEYNLRETLEESVNEIMPKLKQGDVLLLAGCQGMDKGARFVWDYLLKNGPTEIKPEILNRIANRVC